MATSRRLVVLAVGALALVVGCASLVPVSSGRPQFSFGANGVGQLVFAGGGARWMESEIELGSFALQPGSLRVYDPPATGSLQQGQVMFDLRTSVSSLSPEQAILRMGVVEWIVSDAKVRLSLDSRSRTELGRSVGVGVMAGAAQFSTGATSLLQDGVSGSRLDVGDGIDIAAMSFSDPKVMMSVGNVRMGWLPEASAIMVKSGSALGPTLRVEYPSGVVDWRR